MKILVLNCGSSSIKYKLFDMDSQSVIASGGIEKIGLPGSFLKLSLPGGGKKILERHPRAYRGRGVHPPDPREPGVWRHPVDR